MANFVTIEAEARPRAGKGAARATRRAGKVPAVIYGAKQAPSPDRARSARRAARDAARAAGARACSRSSSTATPTRALIRDVQFHPVTDAPEHVDFQRLAPARRSASRCAVHFDNEGISPGLKRGGVLNVVRHAVEVLLPIPKRMPERFNADLGTLDINDNVRWHDLQGHRGRAPDDHRPRLRDRDRGAADQDGRSAGRRGRGRGAAAALPGAKPAARRARAARAKGAGQEGLIVPDGVRVPCGSGSGSATRSRGWPGSATTSASWRST